MQSQSLNIEELIDRAAAAAAEQVLNKLTLYLPAAPISTDPAALLSDPETTTKLGFKPGTLAKWRCTGGGPPFLKIGVGQSKAAIRYRWGDVVEWVEARRYDNTAHCVGGGGADDG